MVYLRLFGSPSLEGDDGAPLIGRAVQRHRLALLALLSLAPAQRLSRDKLLAYLWPESDAEKGRNLLNVASYVLRAELGDEALQSVGDDLRLDPELVRSDVADFEASLERGDHTAAIASYRGPFLDGFFVSEAPDFELWSSRERERLAGAYGKALEALAESAEAEQDWPRAVEWWKTRAAHDLYDSRVALRLMQALDASGNRAGALQHAAVHERLLQDEFGVAPPTEISALTERLRKARTRPEDGRGSSADGADGPSAGKAPVVGSVSEGVLSEQSARSAQSAMPDSSPGSGASAPSAQSVARRRAWFAVGFAVLLAVLAVASAWALWPESVDPEPSIVVLPFANLSSDADNEYFSDGLTEEIITRLASVPGLKVISRTSAMHYKGSTQPAREIAAELNVAHILEGSVRESDGRVRITAQLIDARDDHHLWAENYDRELRDIFRVQEEIAHEVVGALELTLGEQARRQLVRQGTRDPEAYRLYRRARFLWNSRTKEGHEQALDYFSRAIERDSGYADAYAGIADVYMTAYQLNLLGQSEPEAYSRLKWAAERALALDGESADAHVSIGIALLWQRNWPGTERELRRAIELNPGHAIARSWYSLLLRGMGRSEQALDESRRAHELDPFSVVASNNYGWQCYLMRDHDCAITQLRKALEITPYPGALRTLGLTYAARGMTDSAIASIRKAIELAPERPEFVADLAYVQALAGRTGEARANLRASKERPLEGFNIARAHVALGEADSAFAWFERSNWRWPHRAALADPALDPVRSDPRYAPMVERIEREMGIR